MAEAVNKLLNERDGLALGICNGFQALIKLGLVPHGEIRMQTEDSPTLTYNTINRHISKRAHSERRGNSVAVNIYGEQYLKIFESGVALL